jgi:hypothetical protein
MIPRMAAGNKGTIPLVHLALPAGFRQWLLDVVCHLVDNCMKIMKIMKIMSIWKRSNNEEKIKGREMK